MSRLWPSLRRKGRAAAEAGAPPPASRINADHVLRRLEWTVIRRLDGILQGDYRTLFRGFGLDFANLREYQPHDDVRYIDWNVTARLQVPYVREFQEDREVAAWFLLDLSGSVDFGSGITRKLSLSIDFVAVMARLLTRQGNRVGAVLYRNGVDDVVPARAGRRHVLHLLARIGEPPKTSGEGRETDLGELLNRAQGTINRRSVVFVVSDFISRPGWDKALSLLARRHEVVAVRLFDPLEVALPNLGLVVMQDAETGEQLFVDSHDRSFRERFVETSKAREQALRLTLAQAGVDCVELATDDRLDEALLRFTRLRKRRSQLAAGGAMQRSAML
jgi:uncharacterized protein (DUF58 family)